jgi:hypothetical protein
VVTRSFLPENVGWYICNSGGGLFFFFFFFRRECFSFYAVLVRCSLFVQYKALDYLPRTETKTF